MVWQCVHFLRLCRYNIPYLTPTKIFWIHKLTYFFFIDVFHGIFVPLKMEVPWDLNKPAPEGFYVGQGHAGTLEPRRCQDEVETTKFLAQRFKRDEGRKIRKMKQLDIRKVQPECQSEHSTKSITVVAEFSRNEGKEEISNARLLKSKQSKPPSPPNSLDSSAAHSQIYPHPQSQLHPLPPSQVHPHPKKPINLHPFQVSLITHICHGRHGRRPCKKFLAGVNLFRFNVKNWQFTV